MPGRSLKLNALIYRSPYPHSRLRPLTSAAAADDADDKLQFPAVPTTRAWWRRITIPSLSRDRIFRDRFVLGFRAEKCSSHLAVRSISTAHMGSDPRNKDGQWLNASSPPPTNLRHVKPSARPPKSAKLLTLPTILTIGRVAAVPLLVSCKFLGNNAVRCTSCVCIYVLALLSVCFILLRLTDLHYMCMSCWI